MSHHKLKHRYTFTYVTYKSIFTITIVGSFYTMW